MAARRQVLLLSVPQLVQLLARVGAYCPANRIRTWSRESGGYFLVDKKVDLIRFIGWAYMRRQRALASVGGYEAHREKMRLRQLASSRAARDIAPIPQVADKGRKDAGKATLKQFCSIYLSQTFTLPWSPDHLKVIAKIERAVLEGGLFAMAMPRGSGKTSLCEAACLWSILYGYRRFVVLIGASAEHASQMLESLRVELEANDLLADDFPEVCHAVRSLQSITQRATSQLYEGRPTYMEWSRDSIVMPMIPGSVAGGGVIRVAGLTAHFRGMKHKLPDGSTIRPSLVLIDDPQTDESARSPSQCAMRERVLAGAILGLAGPGKKIAGLMTVTVMFQDDMADRLLDRDKHPQWQGERTKLVYEFPSNEKLWAKYAEIRADSLRNDKGIGEATEFYAKHRKAMDKGAKIAWAERFNEDELSAVQHAMDLRYERGDAAFWSEYQNEPLPDDTTGDDLLTAIEIAAKTNGVARKAVPIACTHLTAFIDIQAKCLFWIVVAWEDNFSGYVIDYGTEPDQKLAYFTLRDVRRTLQRAKQGSGLEGAIYAGLERLADRLFAHEWRRDDGAMIRVDRCLIDANWAQSTDVVYQFCRQSKHAATVLPSHGRYVGASGLSFSEYKKKRGDRVGLNWRIPIVTGKRAVRHALYDTNYWKSFVHTRLAVPMGDPGCLSLFGHRPEQHRMFADHLTAEYRVKTEGRGRTVDEWKMRGVGVDNHWLDCIVGAAVAASMNGAILFGTDAKPVARKRLKLSELQRTKR